MNISFDLDGVLIENPFMSGVFPAVKKILCEQYSRLYGPQKGLEDLIWQEIVREFKRRLIEKPWQAYNWDDVIQKVAEDIGCPGGIDVVSLVKHYSRTPYIKVYDEAPEVLSLLKEKGFTLKVITNGFLRYQLPVLKALGLAEFFEDIISPQETGYIKPQQKIFSLAYQPGECCYHVGDSPLQDVLGGKRSGAKTVWVNRRLPSTLSELTPEERILSDEGSKLFKDELEEEMKKKSNHYSADNLREVKPDYVIQSLRELIYILIEN